MGPGEVRRIERWLATARVFLAVSALVAIWMDPGAIRYSLWAFALLAFYLAQGMVIIIFLRRRQQSTPAFRLLVHSADIVWPALISVFASGQNNPFFLFFVFVLAAAAYRWGLWETVGTAAAEVSLLWLQALSFHWGLMSWVTSLAARYRLPPLRIDPTSFEPKGLFMRSVYLLVLGFLLGYLAEQQKQLRAEKAVIARTLGKARVEAGVAGTLHEIASELLSMYRARLLVIASQELSSYRVYVGELSNPEQASGFHWLEPSDSDRQIYLKESPSVACYAERDGSGGKEHFSLLALDEETRIENVNPEFLDPIARKHEFHSAMMVSFVFGQEWRGRLFLLDPKLTGETEEELRFARELHDGAIQSLIAVEMQVDVLRRHSAIKPDVVPKELGRIQALLREEVLKLRELMQQMKTLDVDSKKLLGVIHDTVERFQRETGIVARFTSDLEELDMPQPICRELARIVQEEIGRAHV